MLEFRVEQLLVGAGRHAGPLMQSSDVVLGRTLIQTNAEIIVHADDTRLAVARILVPFKPTCRSGQRGFEPRLAGNGLPLPLPCPHIR